MKKNKAYILACSNKDVFAAGNVALSLNKYMPNEDFDIIIYFDNLDESNKLVLEKISNVHLKKIEFNKSFIHEVRGRDRFLYLRINKCKNLKNPFSIICFEIFNLLNFYRTVIWLDVDVSIQGDISNLDGYGPIGLPKDLNCNRIRKVGDFFGESIENYNMSIDCYSTACIVVTDKLANYHELSNYCYEKAIKHASLLKKNNQAIFQLLLQDYHIQPRVIPSNEYCCLADHELASIAKIVYFGSYKKPWNDQSYIQCFPEWFRTHLIWLSLGGSDFDRTNLSIRSIWSDLNQPIEKKQKKTYFTRIIFLNIQIATYKKSNNNIEITILGVPFISFYYSGYKTSLKILGKIELLSQKKQEETTSYSVLGIKLFSLKSKLY